MMMTLKNVLYTTMVLCCAALMTGCSDDESIITNNGRLITFAIEDNWGDAPAQSRATRATSKDGTFSVEVITVDEHSTRATGEESMPADYGVYADYDDDGDGNGVQQFMNNQRVKPDGTYDPVKYWSADPTDEYLFYAYAPHVENPSDNSNTIDESTAKVTYEIGKDDIMWAKKINGKSAVSGDHWLSSKEGEDDVKFSFDRKTSRLRFIFDYTKTNEQVEPTINITSIEITHTAKKATLDIKTGELTPDETTCPLSLEPDTDPENGWTVAAGETMPLKDFYIVPDGKKRFEFKLEMDGKTYTIGDGGGELNVIPKAGESYLITLKFDNENIVDPPSISEEGVMKISTARHLLDALQGDYADRVHTYILTDNIELSGKEGVRAPSKILSGPDQITFDGGGYTISNFNIKGDGPFAGLFDIVASGNVVKNLTLQDFSVVNTYFNNEDGEAMASGGIAGKVEGATIENCHVKDFTNISATHADDTPPLGAVAAGGIVGYALTDVDNTDNRANIYGCTVMGATTSENFGSNGRILAYGNTNDTAGDYIRIGAGGIVGLTNGDVMACCVARVSEIASKGAALGHASGGLIGGPVEGTLGAIVGNYCDNIDCDIHGEASKYKGGILGNIETSGTIETPETYNITSFTISSNFYNGDRLDNSIGGKDEDQLQEEMPGAFIYIESDDWLDFVYTETSESVLERMNSALSEDTYNCTWKWVLGEYEKESYYGEGPYYFPYKPTNSSD